jgi:nickel-dependent lactate racemase
MELEHFPSKNWGDKQETIEKDELIYQNKTKTPIKSKVLGELIDFIYYKNRHQITL